MCLLARAIETAFRPHKLNYELLGNQVPHLHWHLFPRYADDPDALQAGLAGPGRGPSATPAVRQRLQTGRRAARRDGRRPCANALQRLGAPTSMTSPPHRHPRQPAGPVAGQPRRRPAAPAGRAAPVELVQIETAGDRVRDVPLSQIGGDGAVHQGDPARPARPDRATSPSTASRTCRRSPSPGWRWPPCRRAGRPATCSCRTRHAASTTCRRGPSVATSSLRRRAQLLHRRPDLKLVDIRGNVETRLRKLDEQDLDAIILAEAGLERLGLASDITEILDPPWMLPAVGQGALGLECRADDAARCACCGALNDAADAAGGAGRAGVAARPGRRLPGADRRQRPWSKATRLALRAAVLPPDGTRRVAGDLSGLASEAEALGERLAEQLLAQGARELLGNG